MGFLVCRIVVLSVALLSLQIPLGGPSVKAEEVQSWQAEWERTVKAAEKEEQLSIYALSGVNEIFLYGGFQKRFPKIKLSTVSANGHELLFRIMNERRAGKFLTDVGSLGNQSPYALYQSKALDPLPPTFILPEVKDESKWWGGKYHYMDDEGKHILVYVGAPLRLVAHNTNLVNPNEFKSYWDLLNPKWRGKIAAFDLKASGFAVTRDRFFFYHPELGPEFLTQLYRDMDITLYRQYPQGENWLASGKFALCLCRHQSIDQAKGQGLPVDLVDPQRFKEGIGLDPRGYTLVLMNKAPHPNAAKVFINWFLSREGQANFQKEGAHYSPVGAEFSLRMDIPKDGIPPKNRLLSGVKYIPQWDPEMIDVKPIKEVVNKALAEARKK